MDSQGMNPPPDSPAPPLPAASLRRADPLAGDAAQNLHVTLTDLPAGTRLAFVILHHTAIDTPHFDLLLDIPAREKLLTWRIIPSPHTWAATPPAVQRLPDHRRHYLTYEGPISGDRGRVRRIASGQATLLSRTATHLTLALDQPPVPALLLPLAQSL